jgi:hypothetical protein
MAVVWSVCFRSIFSILLMTIPWIRKLQLTLSDVVRVESFFAILITTVLRVGAISRVDACADLEKQDIWH